MGRVYKIRAVFSAVLLIVSATACRNLPANPRPAAASVIVEETEAWRSDATPADVEKIDRLAGLWQGALAEARRAGFARRITVEGPLLDPGAALPRGAPPPGAYQCRAVRIGALAPRGRAFATGRQGFCYVGVEDGQLSLSVEVGVDRAGGYLWEEKEGRRAIFLGASVRPGSRTITAYGEDPARDLVGTVERVGNFRYRLLVPGYGAKLAIFELKPAPGQ